MFSDPRGVVDVRSKWDSLKKNGSLTSEGRAATLWSRHLPTRVRGVWKRGDFRQDEYSLLGWKDLDG